MIRADRFFFCVSLGFLPFCGKVLVLMLHIVGWRRKQWGVCGEFDWVRSLVACFLYKTNPNPRKNICCGKKSGPNATFSLFFLGLGWPWVGEFDGFMLIFVLFSTQYNLVDRKHSNDRKWPVLVSFF